MRAAPLQPRGMVPVLAHTRRSIRSCSMAATALPSSAAAMAALCPPGA
jgi:hypothetical protein